MKKFLIAYVSAVLVCSGTMLWAGTGGSGNYNVSERVYNEIIRANYEDNEEGEIDSYLNKLTISAGTFNGNIITGESENGDAYQNELTVSGGTINSAHLKAGVSQSAAADDNTLIVRNVTLQSNIVAGEGAVGANDNTATLENTTVNFNSAAGNQVIAGKGYSGTVEYNNLNITSGSVLDTDAAAGFSAGTASVAYNTLTVSGASSIKNSALFNTVMGGYSAEGDVYHNQITLQDASSVEADLYGGYSDTSVAEYNLVLVNQADVSGAVYGGYSAAGSQVYGNEVRLNGGTASGLVAGGWIEGTGNALNNKVTVTSASGLTGSSVVYGGYAEQGEAAKNQVKLSSEQTGSEVYGGYAKQGNVSSNTLSVSGAQAGGAVLAGGWANAAEASGNTLSVSDSAFTVSGGLYGGYGAASATGNVLSVANADLTSALYGGYSQTGAATGNTFSASGSTLTGNVYGGYAAGGEASGNTVTLDNVTVNGDVYAGYTTAGAATNNNTLVLSGATQITGNFYGGNGSTATGNALLLNSYTGTIGTLNNFDSVTLRGLDSQVTFTEDVQNVQVVLYGKPSEVVQTLAYTPGNSSFALSHDALGAYSYVLQRVSQDGQISWNVVGSYQNNLAKPYAQAQLAYLTLAAQGEEMLSSVFDRSLQLNETNDTFANLQYYDNSYDTGSSFDMQSFAFQAGRWFKAGENVWGLFAQYGHGHYSTDPVKAVGDADTFALGGFVLLPYSDQGRFEATLRAGYQQGDFSSGANSSDFDQKSFYGGLSAGLVQNISSLQLYGKMQWLYLMGDDVKDNLGQQLEFKDTQSVIGRFGARLDLGTWGKRYKPYLGVSGIYELDADSNVRVDGHRVNDADLAGLTGQAEIGVAYENEEAMMPMKSSLSVFGLAGQTQGWGANVRLAFSF